MSGARASSGENRASVLGRQGEDLAARFVARLGWSILGRNVRFRCGELDLVCRDADEIVVVEVRVRSIGVLQPPETTVGPTKMRRLVRAGRTYTERVGWDGPWRIDLLALTVDRRGAWSVEHLRDITGGMAWA